MAYISIKEQQEKAKQQPVYGEYKLPGQDWKSGEIPEQLLSNPIQKKLQEKSISDYLNSLQSKWEAPPKYWIKTPEQYHANPIQKMALEKQADLQQSLWTPPPKSTDEIEHEKLTKKIKEIQARELQPTYVQLGRDIGKEPVVREATELEKEHYEEHKKWDIRKEVDGYYRMMQQRQRIVEAFKFGLPEIPEGYEEPETFKGHLWETFKYCKEDLIDIGMMGYIESTARLVGISPAFTAWAERKGDEQVIDLMSKPELLPSEDMIPIVEWKEGITINKPTAESLARILGSTLMFSGTAFATALVGGIIAGPTGALAGGYAACAALEQGTSYHEMLRKGMTPQDASLASSFYGVVSSIIENMFGISPARAAKHLVVGSFQKTLFNELLKKPVLTTLKVAIEEGAEEVIQQFAENLITSWWVENQELFSKNMIEQFVGGFIGGGLLGALGGAAMIKTGVKGLTIKDVSKELEPLAGEARKYKSVEDFVRGIEKKPELLPTLKRLQEGEFKQFGKFEETVSGGIKSSKTILHPTRDFYNQATKAVEPISQKLEPLAAEKVTWSKDMDTWYPSEEADIAVHIMGSEVTANNKYIVRFVNRSTDETISDSASTIAEAKKIFTELKAEIRTTKAVKKVIKDELIDEETVITLRGTKGMTADDIMKKYPDIQLKQDVPAKDVYGNKVEIPKGEELTPYELKGNKVLLQDGQTYLVSKNQFQNIKGKSVSAEAKPFAPELEKTEETIRGGQDLESEIDRLMSDEVGKGMTRTEAKEFILQNAESEIATKFEDYQLPGGKDYKEILIQAPVETRTVKDFKGKEVESGIDTFKSPHWEESNVLSHIRMNERTYKGKKVSFLEELQSDWASEGREKGFVGKDIKVEKIPTTPSDTTPTWYHLEEEIDGKMVSVKTLDERQAWAVANKRNTKLAGGLDATGPPNNAIIIDGTKELIYNVKVTDANGQSKIFDSDFAGRRSDVTVNDLDAEDYVEELKKREIPFNPLLKNWQETSIKRALQEAVKNNADYFAWITGEQTSARYNLATYLDNVEWEEHKGIKGSKDISMFVKGDSSNPIQIIVDEDGIVKDVPNAPSETLDWPGKKLNEVVGKGLADKIMAKPKGTLSGEGLKFGGEWAINLYDKQVANIVKDLTGVNVIKLDLGLPIEASKTYGALHFVGKEIDGFSKDLGELVAGRLEVGSEFVKSPVFYNGKIGEGNRYIITDVLRDGKFRAKPKDKIGEHDTEMYKETFDISIKKAIQQGIKLTPEIKAKIKSEAPKIKTSGKQFQVTKKDSAIAYTKESRGKLISKEVALQTLRRYFNEQETKFLTQTQLIRMDDGTVAFGSSEAGLITVVEENGMVRDKVLYHEMWHQYLQLFYTQKERTELNSAVTKWGREKRGTSITLNEAEEVGADYFSDFLARRQAFTGKLLEIFQRIALHIRGWIGKKSKIMKTIDEILEKKRPEELPPLGERGPPKAKKLTPEEQGAIRKAKPVKRIKPIVEQKIEILSQGKDAETQANILMELEMAEAGERFYWDDAMGDTHVEGVSSTFPKWIPEKLRKRKLVDAVLEHLREDTLPKKADEVRLYNVVAEQLGLIEAIKKVGEESKIDVSELFTDEENINEQISKVGRGKDAKVGEDIAKIIENAKPPSAKKVIGVTPSPFVKKREYTLLKDRIKNIHKGFREGRITTKAEIRATQAKLLKALDESKLGSADKEKFSKTVKNVQTKKQLEKVFPDFLERIARLEKSTGKRILKARIKKELRKLTAKRAERGKTSVEYEMLRGAIKQMLFDKGKVRTQAQNEELLISLQANIENYDIKNPVNAKDLVLYALLSESTKGIDEMSVGELDAVLTRILQTRKIARDSFLFKQIDRAIEIQKKIEGSVENMQGKGVREQTASNKRTIAKKLKQFVSTADIYDRGFLQIINLLDSIRGGKFYKDVIYQPISEANKDYFQKNEDALVKDEKMLKSVFDKKGTLLDIQINKLSKQVYIGEMIDAQNNKLDMWYSSLEMIDLYLSSKTEANLQAMKEQGVYVKTPQAGTRVFYMTGDVLATIEKKMSKEAKSIADYILKNIQDKSFTKEMTTAYENKYNKPFPFVKGGYWTMRRRYMGTQQKGSDVFNPEYNQKTILSPSSFKERVENDNPLVISDGWTKYIKWRSDILKFIAYDKSLINAKSIIMSSDFKSEFIELYGSKSYAHLLSSFDVTANGGKNYSDIMAKGANYIRQVLSVAFIGGKSRNILSQGTSFVAATADIPIRDFNRSLGKFIIHPKKAYNKMMTSPIIRLRHKRANFTKGLFETETRKFKQYGFSATKTSMFFTKVGDMVGVIGAGYAVYDYNYNQYLADKMNPKEADKRAMQDAENFVVSTQQSALLELKNAIMQSHPLIRTTGAFQQAQSMYRAKGYETMNTWLNSEHKWNRANFRRMAKGVFTYHFVLPALYELSRGNINPLSLTAKAVFSPISGFMGYGKVVEYGIMYVIIKTLIPLMGGDDDDFKDILPYDPNTLVGESLKIFQRTVNSMNDWIEGEADEKDMTNIIDSSLMLLRVPAKNIREEYLKFNDIFTGADTSFLRLLQTKWQSEQRTKTQKSKSKKPTLRVRL